MNNPLLIGKGLPPFADILPEHVVPAIEQILETVNAELTELEQNLRPTWAGLIEPSDRLREKLSWAWGIINHLMAVKNSPELRIAYEKSQPGVIQFFSRMGQSKLLYAELKAIRASTNWASMSKAQQRIISAGIRNAELSGVGLTRKKAERFNNIQIELAALSTQFSNNLLDATKEFHLDLADLADVDGLPLRFLEQLAQASRAGGQEAATPENGPWRITLDSPIYVPFMRYSKQRHLREKVYKAFVARASSGEKDNCGNIEQILTLRREMSQILGFSSFAELSLSNRMAPNVAAVENLLESLRKVSFPAAKKERQELQDFAQSKDSEVTELQNWDIPFWAGLLREQKYDFNDEELRPYFPLEQVLSGLFDLSKKLFGIEVTACDGQVPIWHPDVRYFKVEEDGETIAYFYLDPYSRSTDKRGVFVEECIARAKFTDEEAVRLPVAYLVCDQTPPVGGKPSLMSFGEVQMLFHEFGHTLQHMLTTVDYAGCSGFRNVELDAIELPSQFMENWCYHRLTLLSMGKHYETGEPLPDHYYDKLVAAKNFMSGGAMLWQIHFSWIDIALHHEYVAGTGRTANDLLLDIAKTTTVATPIPEDRFLCCFNHIFDGSYAAGYYSYKWAEVLSADAFAVFEDVDLDDPQTLEGNGRRFRDTVLALGGGEEPLIVFKSFRGREPDPTALLRHSGLLAS
jgi:oligopeptidase A